VAETSLVFNILARDKASSTFDKLKGKAALLGAAIGVMAVKFGKDGVSAASDLSETINKSNVIFGKNASAIEKWADGAAKNLGLSKSAALESAAGFGNMFSQLGFTGDQAAKLSKNVVRMSADLGSFNNLPTAQVADMMSAAFRGEYDSLQRLIPNINAARVEQQALAMTHKSSAKDLTASEKAAATLAIVQKDGAAAAGDFARTSGSLANQQKILSASYQDVAAKAGGVLLPVITSLAGAILDVIGFVQRNATTMKILAGVVGVLTVAVGGLVAVSKIHALVLLAQTEGTFAYGVAQKAGAAWTGIVTAAQWAWNAALSANPIGLVIIGIAALVAGIIIAYNKSETFRRIVDAAFRGVAEAGEFMWDVLRKAFNFVTNAWLTVAGVIIDGAVRAFGWIPGIGDKLRGAQEKFHEFRDSVNAALNGVKNSVSVSMSISGGQAAINEIAALRYQLANVPRSITVGVLNKVQNIPAYAHGTLNHPGGMAMVGERGPELVSLPRNSSVYTAGETRQMMGAPMVGGGSGGGTNVNITVNSLDPRGAATAVKEALDAYVARNGKLRGLTV